MAYRLYETKTTKKDLDRALVLKNKEHFRPPLKPLKIATVTPEFANAPIDVRRYNFFNAFYSICFWTGSRDTAGHRAIVFSGRITPRGWSKSRCSQGQIGQFITPLTTSLIGVNCLVCLTFKSPTRKRVPVTHRKPFAGVPRRIIL